jgi:hypothetical protein
MPGRGERQHLKIDSVAIHVGKPVFSEIREPTGVSLQGRTLEGRALRHKGSRRLQAVNPECFFQCHDAHAYVLSSTPQESAPTGDRRIYRMTWIHL